MTDFPRGWTLNTVQKGTGVAPTITVPATAGVVHVLDSLAARIINNSAGALYVPTVSVVIAAVNVLQDIMVLAATQAGADTTSFSGLELATAPGGSLIVSFDTGPGAGLSATLTIQGHDI